MTSPRQPADSGDLEISEHPEQTLWRAVLLQGIRDAMAKGASKIDRAWLLSEDFKTVCDWVGVQDPDLFLKKLKAGRKRGFQWRLPPGQGWRSKTRQKPEKESRSCQRMTTET